MSRKKIKAQIEHPKLYFAMFKPYYFDIILEHEVFQLKKDSSGKDYCPKTLLAFPCAAMLDFFDFTNNMKCAKESGKDYPILWQYQTDKNLSKRLRIKPSSVHRCIKILSDLGLIKVWNYASNNWKDPFGKNPISTIRWILFNKNFVQAKIEQWNIKNNDEMREMQEYEKDLKPFEENDEDDF